MIIQTPVGSDSNSQSESVQDISGNAIASISKLKSSSNKSLSEPSSTTSEHVPTINERVTLAPTEQITLAMMEQVTSEQTETPSTTELVTTEFITTTIEALPTIIVTSETTTPTTAETTTELTTLITQFTNTGKF